MIMTDLTIVAGLPYSRRIRVKEGTNLWPRLELFEVRSELRVAQDSKSRLKQIWSPFFIPSIEGKDIVLSFDLTDTITRDMPSGYYDVIIRDRGRDAKRAIRVLGGQLKTKPIVTGA